MHHSVQGLAGGRSCEGSAADGNVTCGAESIAGVSARSVMPSQQFLPGRWISSGLLQVMESPCLGKPKSYIEEGFAQRFSKIHCFIS